MALTVVDDGTTTPAALDTPETLGAAQTAAGVYVLLADITNLSGTDVVVLRAKVKVLASSTARVFEIGTYSIASLGEPVVASSPIPVGHSVEFTIEQTDGTLRAFDWAILQVA